MVYKGRRTSPAMVYKGRKTSPYLVLAQAGTHGTVALS